MKDKVFFAIDLKSFYASVECVSRNLNPLTTHLVVADESRTEKTICLAVSPTLKTYGLRGRERLFKVIEKVREINIERRKYASRHIFVGKSVDEAILEQNPNLELSFVVAPPRMAHYIEVSSKIYEIYLKYIAKEDIHVYSIDEVFIDATEYLSIYHLSKEDFARKLVQEVFKKTGITATAGIGTNLYLSKVAMDIVAKHQPADHYGVRVAYLDEELYKKLLWTHQPLTDFWRVGRGIAKRLESIGLHTMGDVARCSLTNEESLYRMFGINAELLIDHAWGYEPTRMEDIKNYRPASNCLSSGQVLACGYPASKALIVVKEMMDQLSLELVEKKLVTNFLHLVLSYDSLNLLDENIQYDGEITTNYYGKRVPKHAKGTIRLEEYTSSTRILVHKIEELFLRIVNQDLLVRRIGITACNVIDQEQAKKKIVQLNLFTDEEKVALDNKRLEKEKKEQEAILKLKKKYGKNAVIKGIDLEEGATARQRNEQIGGHKA